jgi:hypothetical protein
MPMDLIAPVLRGTAGAAGALMLGLAALAGATVPVPAHAQVAGAMPSLPAPAWVAVTLGSGSRRFDFPVYANMDLNGPGLRDIRHVLIIVHGADRNADAYYQTAAGLLWLNPQRAHDTLVIAPRFAAPIDRGFEKLPAWRHAGWIDGQESVKGPHRPAPVSSFEVLDDLLKKVGDRQAMPNVQDVVMAGHSAGAQMLQRYAVLNRMDGTLKSAGVEVRYVIANPSSYLYFTRDRPKDEGARIGPYDPGQCPDFDHYKYGLDQMPADLRGLEPRGRAGAVELARRYAQRNVTYLLGQADNNPEHRLLDKNCEAEAQGSTRLARGRGYLSYEAWLPALRGTAHAGYEVAGVGHSQRRMFASVCGTRALLGDQAQGPTDAAVCSAPQLPRR